MKPKLKSPLLFLLLLAVIFKPHTTIALGMNAAVATDTSSSDLIIPPLDSLFLWAEANSPVLKGQDALVEKTTEDQKRIKMIILDVFKLNSNIQNGNYGNPTINQLQTGYSSGASLSFSLYQIAGYRNQVKSYGAERKVAIYKKDELQMDLRKLVVILYNSILTQKNVLKIRSEASYSAYSHVKMAEKEFSEGSIAISELSRVTEIYTKAQVDYELSFNDLKNAYMQLEQIVGRPLN